MRHFGAWGLEVALVVGLTATAVSAADDNEDAPHDSKPQSHAMWGGNSKGLLGHWFGNDKPSKPLDKKAADKPAEKPDKEAKPAAKPTNLVDEAVAERRREEEIWLRRMAVCDRLSAVALQTNDVELQRQVDQLLERCQMVYSQRTAHLGCSAGRFQSDEKVLEKHLGAGAADSERQTGTPPLSNADGDRNGRAAREERP